MFGTLNTANSKLWNIGFWWALALKFTPDMVCCFWMPHISFIAFYERVTEKWMFSWLHGICDFCGFRGFLLSRFSRLTLALRPIEHFWDWVKQHVYDDNSPAKNQEQLVCHIKCTIKEFNNEEFQALYWNVKKKSQTTESRGLQSSKWNQNSEGEMQSIPHSTFGHIWSNDLALVNKMSSFSISAAPIIEGKCHTFFEWLRGKCCGTHSFQPNDTLFSEPARGDLKLVLVEIWNPSIDWKWLYKAKSKCIYFADRPLSLVKCAHRSNCGLREDRGCPQITCWRSNSGSAEFIKTPRKDRAQNIL